MDACKIVYRDYYDSFNISPAETGLFTLLKRRISAGSYTVYFNCNYNLIFPAAIT